MKSIRTKMIVLFGLSMFVLMSLTAAVIVYRVNSTFIPYAEESAGRIGEARSDEIGELLNSYMREIKSLSKLDAFTSGNINTAKDLFKNITQDYNSDFDYLIYAIPSGRLVTSLLAETDVTDRDYFKAIIVEGKDSFTSMPAISRTTKRQVFYVVSSVKNAAGKTVALLGATVKLDTLTQIASRIKIGEAGYGWLADGTGLMIAHPDKKAIMKLNLLKASDFGYDNLDSVGKNIVNGKQGISNIVLPDGRKAVTIYNPVNNSPNWSLGITIPRSELLSRGYSLLNTILVIISIIIACVIAVILILAKYISAPLRASAEHIERIGNGDLTITVSEKSMSFQDELGIISRAISKTVSSIKTMIENVQVHASELTDSSREMKNTAVSFAENAQNSASTLEELTAAVEEISAGMDSVTANADVQTHKLNELMSKMENLTSVVSKMGELINGALERGKDISRMSGEGALVLEAMNKSMAAIAESSGDMVSIIKIINDISEQINLLSLNAAIEAARAGEAGRGFAVVADEISKLADQTSLSLKDIDRLIKENGEEINRGKETIEITTSTIRSITGAIDSITANIGMISEQMDIQTAIYGEVQNGAGFVKYSSEEITNSMGEQKTAMREIMQSVADINDTTQQNAAGAEEMSGSMENLSSLAVKLYQELGIFKVK